MNKKYLLLYLIALTLTFFFNLSSIKAQQTSLALTPPMGWSSWYPFVDTINEKKIIEMADAIVSTGLRDAGYVILQLDNIAA